MEQGRVARLCSSRSSAVPRTLLAALAALVAMLATAVSAGAAPVWLPPDDLSAPLRKADDADVEMDRQGGTVAIWEREGTTPFNRTVQVSIRPPSSPWPAATTIASPAQDPVLAMNDAGEAIAAWWDTSAPGDEVLRAAVKPPGGSFGPAQEIAHLPLSFTGSPPPIKLAMNEAGQAAIVWERVDPGAESRTVQAALRAAGAGFAVVGTISDAPEEAAGPDVAIDAAGRVIAVWAVGEGEPGSETSWPEAAVGTVGGGFGPAEALFSERERAGNVDVALSPGGEALIAWRGVDNPEEDEEGEPVPAEPPVLEATAAQLTGTFPAPKQLSEAGATAFAPIVAVDRDGFLVAWVQQQASLDAVLKVASKGPGAPLPSPAAAATVTGAGPGHVAEPSIDVNGEGTALLAFQKGAAQVQATLRPPGGAFGPATTLDSSGRFPDVTVGETGDAAVAWRFEPPSGDWRARVAGYDATPPVVRSVSIPASGTVGDPVAFAAEPFDVWGIASSGFAFGDGAGAAGSAATHAYGAPGAYPVTFTATDLAGNAVSAGGSVSIAVRPARLRVGKQRRNRRRGTVVLTVRVSGPGLVTLRGKGVVPRRKRARRAGPVKLLVKAKGGKLRRLNRRGRLRVRVNVAFRPADGAATVRRRVRVLLVKR